MREFRCGEATLCIRTNARNSYEIRRILSLGVNLHRFGPNNKYILSQGTDTPTLANRHIENRGKLFRLFIYCWISIYLFVRFSRARARCWLIILVSFRDAHRGIARGWNLKLLKLISISRINSKLCKLLSMAWSSYALASAYMRACVFVHARQVFEMTFILDSSPK